jgi:hypothetical protein
MSTFHRLDRAQNVRCVEFFNSVNRISLVHRSFLVDLLLDCESETLDLNSSENGI